MDSINVVFQSLNRMMEGFPTRLPQLVIGAVVLIIAWLIAKAVDRFIIRIGREATDHRVEKALQVPG